MSEYQIMLTGVGTGFGLYFVFSLFGYAIREMINLFKQ